MNPYYESELESRDLFCEMCGESISTQTYIECDGMCFNCFSNIQQDTSENFDIFER